MSSAANTVATGDAASAIDPRALREAAGWLARLHGGDLDERGREAWLRWRARDADNERAWLRAERLQARLGALPVCVARPSLERASDLHRRDRRRALHALLLLGAAVPLGYGIHRQAPVWTADHRTAIGEWRRLTLADGSLLALDTGCAVDVEFRDRGQRRLRLHRSEILIDTAAAASSLAPLIVETAHGRLRTLGGRLTVRALPGGTRVAVAEGAVELLPAAGATRILQAGSQCTFDAAGIGASSALREEIGAWADGILLASDRRLDEFLSELARYRSGILRCAAEVATMRISGAFQLRDTQRILELLASSLPIRVRRRGGLWTVVEGTR